MARTAAAVSSRQPRVICGPPADVPVNRRRRWAEGNAGSLEESAAHLPAAR